jgi:hypothetical protein
LVFCGRLLFELLLEKRFREKKLEKKSMTRKRKWSLAYKKSINCNKPKGVSQKQHCKYGKTKKVHNTKK